MLQKITLTSLVLFVLTFAAHAQNGTMSQSVNGSATNLQFGCFYPGGSHQGQSLWRSYTLDSERIGTSIEVLSITFAVATDSPTSTQPVEIRLYTDPDPSSLLPTSELRLIHTESFSIANFTSGTVLTQPLSAPVSVASTDTLVVRLRAPDGLALGNRLAFRGNNLGETAPGYISCLGSTPTDTSVVFGQPVHIILDVNYRVAPRMRGSHEDLELGAAAALSGPYPSGPADDSRFVVAGDPFGVHLRSPNGTFVGRPFVIVGDVHLTTGTPPAGFPGFPEIHVGSSAFIIDGTLQSPFGPSLLPGEGIIRAASSSPVLGGYTAIIQGIALDGMAANGIFAATDGQQVKFLTSNAAPVLAIPGVVAPGQAIQLPPAVIIDPDDGPLPLTFSWSFSGGVPVSITDPTSPQPTITKLVPLSLTGSTTLVASVSDGEKSADLFFTISWI